MTRATTAMMPGPGKAAATSSAVAKTMSAVRSMIVNPGNVTRHSNRARGRSTVCSAYHRSLERCALPVMVMRDRDRKGIGCILGLRVGLGQQHTDHHTDLRLLG